MPRVNWKIAAISGAVLGVIGVFALSSSTVSSQRVALIGDSYAVGLGPELQKIFPGLRFEGHVGIGTSEWANHSQYGDWLSNYNPTIVLVSLGVNDGAFANQANYQTIVRNLHGIGARVMWIYPPATVDAPAARGSIASLGVQTVSATTTPLAADGLHPISYSGWAQEIAQAVRHG
jgi:hypothetical protein